MANVVSSFFQCYPSAGSLSRSAVQEGSGGKTLLIGGFSSVVLGSVIVALTPLFRSLPMACLAAIIVVNLKSLLFQIADFVFYFRISLVECVRRAARSSASDRASGFVEDFMDDDIRLCDSVRCGCRLVRGHLHFIHHQHCAHAKVGAINDSTAISIVRIDLGLSHWDKWKTRASTRTWRSSHP